MKFVRVRWSDRDGDDKKNIVLRGGKKNAIPRKTIESKIKNTHSDKPGPPLRLTLEEEMNFVKVLVAAINYLANGGPSIPFLEYVVCAFLKLRIGEKWIFIVTYINIPDDSRFRVCFWQPYALGSICMEIFKTPWQLCLLSVLPLSVMISPYLVFALQNIHKSPWYLYLANNSTAKLKKYWA